MQILAYILQLLNIWNLWYKAVTLSKFGLPICGFHVIYTVLQVHINEHFFLAMYVFVAFNGEQMNQKLQETQFWFWR